MPRLPPTSTVVIVHKSDETLHSQPGNDSSPQQPLVRAGESYDFRYPPLPIEGSLWIGGRRGEGDDGAS